MDDHSRIQMLSDRVYRQTRGHADAARPAPALDRPVAKRYRLVVRIGRGRLGEVYEAVDEANSGLGVEQRVAVQLIEAQFLTDPRVIGELERGYADLRTGSHPNIVKILDFGRDSDRHYLVMELLEGASMRFVLDDATVLSMDETIAVTRAAGDSLKYLHAKSIVHGAVSPENVFITYDYAVKLLDIVPLGRTVRPRYYVEDSDAQVPSNCDARDDVYGLACLTYELLSGAHPFNANSPLEAHRAGAQPEPIDFLSARQWHALARGLALERAGRTPTVGAFLAEFGITGTERLSARGDDVDGAGRPAAAPMPAAPVAAVPAQAPGAGFDAPRAPGAAGRASYGPRVERDEEYWHEPRRARDGASRTARFALTLAVLIGLGGAVFLYYERLREGAGELIAAVDERFAATRANEDSTRAVDLGVVPPPAGAEIGVRAPDAHAPESADARALPGAVGEPPVAASTPPGAPQAPRPHAGAASEPAQPAAGPHAASEERAAVAARAEAPADAAPPATAPPAGEAAAAPPSAGQRVPVEPGTADSAAPQADASAGPPRFEFTAAIVRVSERDASAAVVVRRTGDTSVPAAVEWWTEDGSALADEDYADLGQRTERFAAGQDTLTLHVPLIDDAIAERTESFGVYLGRYDAERRHLEALASTRVEIVDDD